MVWNRRLLDNFRRWAQNRPPNAALPWIKSNRRTQQFLYVVKMLCRFTFFFRGTRIFMKLWRWFFKIWVQSVIRFKSSNWESQVRSKYSHFQLQVILSQCPDYPTQAQYEREAHFTILFPPTNHSILEHNAICVSKRILECLNVVNAELLVTQLTGPIPPSPFVDTAQQNQRFDGY